MPAAFLAGDLSGAVPILSLEFRVHAVRGRLKLELQAKLRQGSLSASLDLEEKWRENVTVRFGGVPVSIREMRQRRHAEDDALASLIIASNKTANEELALAA